MAGIGRVSLRAGVAGILVVLLLPGGPSAASAASDEGVVLARNSISSVAADLDGDGEREVVAILAEPEEGAALRVAAWGVRGGDWLSLGEERVERWTGAEGRAAPASVSDTSAALLTIRDGDRTRVILVSAVPYGTESNPGACCLSVSEITLFAGTLRVRLVPEDLGSVDSMTTLDLEADGRDELLVTSYSGGERDVWQPIYEVIRQTDAGFTRAPIPLPEGEQMYFNAAGESDEVPGDDLLFLTTDNRALIRMSADGDDLAVERVPAAGVIDAYLGGGIVGAADGTIVSASERQIQTVRWPRGGQIEALASVAVEIWPYLFVVGEGSAARLVHVTGLDGPGDAPIALRVMDLRLTVEAEVDAPPGAADLRDLAQSGQEPGGMNLYPPIGPIPGGLADGRTAFLGPGMLVAVDSTGGHTVSPAAPLLGGELLGLVGPASEWFAIGSGWFAGNGWAYLGGFGYEPADMPETRLAVAPLDAILDAPSELRVALEGATLVEEPDGPMLYAGEEGFEAVVSGEPGSRVVTIVNRATNTTEIEDEPVTVTLDPPGRTGVDRLHDASILVVSPAGLAHFTSWDLTILPEAPEVTADTSFELFEAHASVFGEVAPMMTVTVDGRPVAMAGDGGFRAQVDASLWPREVELVVRDPIGQQTVTRVEVVGIVDLRELPWIPIIAALTVVAGLVLFLRTPVVRPQERVVMDGDGHLEEIDGDLA